MLNRPNLVLAAAMGAAVLPCTLGCGDRATVAAETPAAPGGSAAGGDRIIGEEVAVLAAPPHVPPPIQRDHATKVIVKLEVREHVMPIADGVDYMFWTFGGTVPGSFIRVRQGDLVEFHLSNHPANRMPHNIDMHAVTGPGGGATSSFTAPGHTSQFSFTVKNPGLFVYHCATAPVGMHIANGMYGLILVEPREGLPPVDREYYVMQGDFYTVGRYGEPGLQPFDMNKALQERPDYVLFNGSVGSLVGDKAIRAKVGDRVRLFVGNGGPNLVSSFHLIGEIFDLAHTEAGRIPNENVQTTLIPAGGAAMVEFGVEVPGTYIMVDHAIFRAFNKGALAMLKVDGEPNERLYSGRQDDSVYLPEGSTVQVVPGAEAPDPAPATTMEERMARGSRTFSTICAACHQPTGLGIPAAFPPLAGSDFLMADKERSIEIVLKGRSGKTVVNGREFNGVMPALQLSDEDIANVLTFVRNSWGNKGEAVTPEEVAAHR